jgi:hypothetical protein
MPWGLSHLLLPQQQQQQQQQCWGLTKSSSSSRWDLAVPLVLLLACVWTSHI